MTSPGLLELATAEDENAKRHLFKLVPIGHLAAVALVVVNLFVPLPWAYYIGVVVLLLQGLVWHLRGVGLGLHRLADEARRRATLIDALGESAERLDVANIRAAISKRACRAAASKNRSGYWAATAPQGTDRLLEQLQESAFWSKHLYAAAARETFKVLGATVLSLALIGLLGLVVFSGETDLAVARVLVVALSALIGLDVLGHARAWQTAAREAERVDRRLEALDPGALEPLVAVVSDYAVATTSAPPIPNRVYAAEKERLDELWREHRRLSQPERRIGNGGRDAR